jgi:hypothetical protein
VTDIVAIATGNAYTDAVYVGANVPGFGFTPSAVVPYCSRASTTNSSTSLPCTTSFQAGIRFNAGETVTANGSSSVYMTVSGYEF